MYASVSFTSCMLLQPLEQLHHTLYVQQCDYLQDDFHQEILRFNNSIFFVCMS